MYYTVIMFSNKHKGSNTDVSNTKDKDLLSLTR